MASMVVFIFLLTITILQFLAENIFVWLDFDCERVCENVCVLFSYHYEYWVLFFKDSS